MKVGKEDEGVKNIFFSRMKEFLNAYRKEVVLSHSVEKSCDIKIPNFTHCA